MMVLSAATPYFDLGVGLIWLLISQLTWIGYVPKQESDHTDERALGASVIMGQLSAIITGSSVILAGIGAFVALETEDIVSPQNYHLTYAASWAVVSMGLALFTMGALPTNAPKHNFVRLRGIAILCSMGLFFTLAAGARFLFAVWSILIP
jgi:hypothetical protein